MIADILLGSSVVVVLVMTLTGLVLVSRTLLVPSGTARITVNGKRTVDARIGDRLLAALEHENVHLPAACGGAGSCGLCRVIVSGAGPVLPIERASLRETEIANRVRLACQVTVRGDLAVTVPAEALTAERWSCTVRHTRGVAPLIKELVLALPEGRTRTFPAGSFVRVSAPPFTLPFADIAIDPAYEPTWRQQGLRRLTARSAATVSRGYSIVNHPGEQDALILNIRLALPPAGRADVPPGVVSSYLFGLRVGATVDVSGPFGNFFIAETDREIVLVGGGVGMAPLRAHVFDQLEHRHTSRPVSYWYGARARTDLYYADDMERLAREHSNFSWHVALSDPTPDDDWDGHTGFIHDVFDREYLQTHPEPARCEYYLCGPPLMVEAVLARLDARGVPRDQIRHDDFGG